MLNHTVATAALMACAVFGGPAVAQERVPESLAALKPHEVVEAFTSEAKALALTQEQLGRLDSLHVAVRDERHRWTTRPSNKAHRQRQMEPMITQEAAYREASAILTPTQREAITKRFDAPDYVPVVPSLATEVPASLDDLKPHEIVQAFSAEAKSLDLSKDQVQDLEALHVAVRDEPHRYTAGGAPGKAHQHAMMEPMISKRRAYNDALSYLTDAQRDRAYKLFNAPGYKPAALQQRNGTE